MPYSESQTTEGNTMRHIFFNMYVPRIFFVLSVFYGLYHVVASIFFQSTTYDEPNHYSWSLAYVSDGVLLPRIDSHISTTPITALHVLSSNIIHFLELEDMLSGMPGVNQEWWPRRMIGVVWYLALIYAVFGLGKLLVARDMAYILAGCIAITPSVIAHSSIVTVDIPFAVITTFLLHFLINSYRTPCMTTYLFTGVFFGLSFVVKFSAILTIPIVVLYFILSFVRSKKKRSMLCYWLLALIVCIFVINMSYACKGVTFYTDAYRIESKELKNIFSILPNIFLPLPESFVSGIDACVKRDSQKSWNVILHDTWYPKGTPTYFLYTFMYKTQLSLIIFTFCGLCMTIFKNKRVHQKALLFYFTVCMFYFSFLFSTQVGFRYIIFLLPVLYLISVNGFAEFFRGGMRLFFCAAVLGESLLSFPKFSGYFLTYYNPLFVPEKQAFKYVIDSNLDWNQTATLFWEGYMGSAPVDPDVLQPGKNIYSANILAGVWWNFSKHAWIRRTQVPSSVKALTYYEYDLSDKAFKQYLDSERFLFENPQSIDLCNKVNISKAFLDPSQKGILEGRYICLQANSPLYIKIKKMNVVGSEYSLGYMTSEGSCYQNSFEKKEYDWYKLDRGFHVLCLWTGTYEYQTYAENELLQ